MEVTPISHEEFSGLSSWRTGRRLMAESQAVVGLEAGTGVKFTCRWNHSKKGACTGVTTLRGTAKRYGQTTSFRCYQGTLYAWRLV